MITIPHDESGMQTPSWSRQPDGAIVVCPAGHNCAIGIPGITRHRVGADGSVLPSVVCPECNFHEFVRLDGWASS